MSRTVRMAAVVVTAFAALVAGSTPASAAVSIQRVTGNSWCC